MNTRLYTTIALNSLLAAAAISIAPLAAASESWLAPPPDLSSPSTSSRAEVRQAAIDARLSTGNVRSDSLFDGTLDTFVSGLSRTLVRAEAVEAVRLGLTGGYEGRNSVPTAAQAEQIRMAGQRAVNAQRVAAAAR
jgi:hypothetical protein